MLKHSLSTIRRHKGKWIFISNQSQLRWQLEVGGQHQVPAASDLCNIKSPLSQWPLCALYSFRFGFLHSAPRICRNTSNFFTSVTLGRQTANGQAVLFHHTNITQLLQPLIKICRHVSKYGHDTWSTWQALVCARTNTHAKSVSTST